MQFWIEVTSCINYAGRIFIYCSRLVNGGTVSPAAIQILLPQEIKIQAAQQRRLMLFFPDGETDMTTSTLFPQALQSFA
jgi:hypothetical protein